MAMKVGICPLQTLHISRHQIPAYQLIPNTSIQKKPLLVYHSVFPSESLSASRIESHVSDIGAVVPQWRYSMYTTSHFHSNTHEVLCIAAGSAICCFGHENNPDRWEVTLSKGDVVIIPAGVAHRLVKDEDGDFEMVGCYPPGSNWDMCYGKRGEERKIEQINKLGWFEKDPIYGNQGPALDV